MNSSHRRVLSTSVGLSLIKDSTNKLKLSEKGNGLTIHHLRTPGKVKYHATAFDQREQFENLKETDRLRRELVTNVSHDLRTPLASMHGSQITVDSTLNEGTCFEFDLPTREAA
jgi:signal transduction histidine kinase